MQAKKNFSKIFKNETKPTKKRLIDLIMSGIALNDFQSIQDNWHIETAYYEQKKFWAMKDYMLRNFFGKC